MENKERVLGFNTSKPLTNEELVGVSGGSEKGSANLTQKMTGGYPGGLDWQQDISVDW